MSDRTYLVLACGFVFVAAFVLLGGHRVLALGILPSLLLLACPLLHLFMHGGRRYGHRGGEGAGAHQHTGSAGPPEEERS